MTDPMELEEASKSESTLLTLFIPSVDRDTQPIEQGRWEQEALELLGKCLGGATAFPKGRGVWRDDQQQGKLIFDETIVIHCYTNKAALEVCREDIRRFIKKLGTEAKQGAVGLVIDRTYFEVRFPFTTKDHTDG